MYLSLSLSLLFSQQCAFIEGEEEKDEIKLYLTTEREKDRKRNKYI
jgi:hypothetical protein